MLMLMCAVVTHRRPALLARSEMIWYVHSHGSLEPKHGAGAATRPLWKARKIPRVQHAD